MDQDMHLAKERLNIKFPLHKADIIQITCSTTNAFSPFKYMNSNTQHITRLKRKI